MRKVISGILTLGLVLGSGTQNAAAVSVEKYTITDFAMDTIVQATLYTTGENLCPQVKAELTALERETLSWTRPDSEISIINSLAGETVEISDALADYLELILDLAENSEGAMDPTLGDVIRLWNIGGEDPHVPSETDLAALMEHVGYRQISLDGASLTLPKGCSLDLGATGKGIGCDQILALFSSDAKLSGGLLSLGGSSVMTYGQKPDGTAWNVAITDPRDPEGDYLGIVQLEGTKFLSTSGDYEKYFIEGGVRYHHILDPKTGYPASSGLCSATVVCDSGLLSDGLSTACMVLGRDEAAALLERYQAEGLLVDEDGQIYATDGMKEMFTLWKSGYQLVLYPATIFQVTQ